MRWWYRLNRCLQLHLDRQERYPRSFSGALKQLDLVEIGQTWFTMRVQRHSRYGTDVPSQVLGALKQLDLVEIGQTWRHKARSTS